MEFSAYHFIRCATSGVLHRFVLLFWEQKTNAKVVKEKKQGKNHAKSTPCFIG
jgi:hypothetical protein